MGVGKIQNACGCAVCQDLCRRPCWGTVEEIWDLLQAGLGGKLEEAYWRIDSRHEVTVLRPRLEPDGYCVFFKFGKCELHDLGLKPSEGVIAHCSNLEGESGRGVAGKDNAQHWDARSRLAYEWDRIGYKTRRLVMREWEKALGLKARKKEEKPKKLNLIDQWG